MRTILPEVSKKFAVDRGALKALIYVRIKRRALRDGERARTCDLLFRRNEFMDLFQDVAMLRGESGRVVENRDEQILAQLRPTGTMCP